MAHCACGQVLPGNKLKLSRRAVLLEDAAAGTSGGGAQQQQQGNGRGWSQLPDAAPAQAAATLRQQPASPLRRQAAGEEEPRRAESEPYQARVPAADAELEVGGADPEQALRRGMEEASSSGRPPAGEAPGVGTVFK